MKTARTAIERACNPETLQGKKSYAKGANLIRYFGFLANANKTISIPLIRKLINPDAEIVKKLTGTVQEMMLRVTGVDISLCPDCGKGKMVCIGPLPKPLKPE